MPEDTEGAVATAEVPVEEIPIEVPTPEEAVPPADQEPVDSEESAESGDQHGEDEAPDIAAVRAAYVAQLREQAQADPDLLEAIKADPAFTSQSEDAEAELTKRELAGVQAGRMGAYQQASGDLENYVPQNGQVSQAQQRLYNTLSAESDNTIEAAEMLNDGKITDPNQVGFDAAALTRTLSPLLDEVRAATTRQLNAYTAAAFYPILEAAERYALLTTEERTAFQAAEQAQRPQEAALVLLNATRRTNPESASKAKEAASNAEAKVLKQYAELNRKFPKHGKPRGGLPASSSRNPKNEQEAINWHATGKWTNAQMRAWRAKQ